MTPQLQRWLLIASVVSAAALVWSKDTTWTANMADTLPLVAGIPFAWWLGRPWTPRETIAYQNQTKMIIIALFGFLIGWMISSLTMLVISWTTLTCCLIRILYQPRSGRSRLIGLILLSFPWIALDWPQIGWWFRLSSAWTAEQFFNFILIPSVREGTHLNVMGVPIDIEPACAGWNLLQLTLLIGVSMGSYEIPSSRRFSIFLCLLPALSWIANFLRILVLTGLALSFDVTVASGVLHGITGLAVIALVLGVSKFLCILLTPKKEIQSTMVSAS